MMKRPSEPLTVASPPRDFAAELAELDAQTATRTDQRRAALASLAEAERTRDTAQTTREAVALAALAEGDAQAQQQRRDALAAFATAQADVEDYSSTLAQLDTILSRLAEQRAALLQARARAEIDAIDHAQVFPALEAAEVAMATLRDALRTVSDARQAQVRIATAAKLPEAGRNKVWNLDFITWRLRWVLPDYVGGPRHHSFEHMKLLDFARLRGSDPIHDTSDADERAA